MSVRLLDGETHASSSVAGSPAVMVEAAWHGRLPPKVGAELSRRQQGQDPLAIERA